MKINFLKAGLIVTSIFLTGIMNAQTPVLVKNIHPSGSSNPAKLTYVNSKLVFTADNGTNGTEFWTTDGTTAGTVLVTDYNPSGSTNVSGDMKIAGNSAFFSGYLNDTDFELYKTDGTSSGTIRVKDINTAGTSTPSGFFNWNGILYFQASDGTNFVELWKSDGTSAGTTMVKDINTSLGGNSLPGSFCAYKTSLFFAADNSGSNTELWKTDGTSAGTVMVADINSTGSASVSRLVTDGTTLYFRATNGTSGNELFKSDGTSVGTVLIKDINPTGNSSPNNLTMVGSTLFFTANDGTNGVELWKSDGTSAGTVMIKDINATAAGSSSSPSNLINNNGILYFTANDGVNGTELWKSDGTASGTTMVKDLNPTAGNSFPTSLTLVDGWMYFIADDGTNGNELYKTDGTSANTIRITTMTNVSTTPMIYSNSLLYFVADDGTNGLELWKLSPCTAPALPTLNATSSSICTGSSSTLSATGSLNSATAWKWYTSSCGGTLVGTGNSIVVSPTVTTTYYVRGEGGCVSPDLCSSITVNVRQHTSSTITVSACSSYELNGTTYTSSGIYSQTLLNSAGCDSIITLNLTINNSANIASEPSPISVNDGSTAQFSISSSNASSINWYVNAGTGFQLLSEDQIYSGVNTATLSIVANGSMNNYIYRSIVSNTCGNDTSITASLQINGFYKQPTDVIDLCDQYNTSFTVGINNATDYFWEIYNNGNWETITNDSIFSGQGTATLNLTLVPHTYNLSQFRCVAFGDFGMNISSTATLTIKSPVSVPVNPSSTDLQPLQVTLHWGNIPDGQEVRVAYRKVGAAYWQFINAPYADSLVINRNYPFAKDTPYEWRVKVKVNGCWSTWSQLTNFELCVFPQIATSLNTTDIYSNKATLRWVHNGAEEIRVAMRKVGNTTWHYQNRPYADSMIYSGIYYMNTAYEWRVKMRCGSNWGNWSSIANFTTGSIAGKADLSTGVEEISENSYVFESFPNPSTGDFTIVTSEESVISIFNEMGQMVREFKTNSSDNFRVKVEGLNTGVYFIRGTVGSEMLMKRIVVIK